MSFERVANQIAADAARQSATARDRAAGRPRLAELDPLIAELEDEVAGRSEALPAELLGRARAFLEAAGLACGHTFPPRRRPELVLDQVFEAASLLHGTEAEEQDPDPPGTAARLA